MYAGDYFVDTITWEPEELGIYLRLLLVEWDNGPLPFDFKRLAKIAGISPKKLSNLWQILSTKFIRNGDGTIYNPRLEETRKKQQEYVELQRVKGQKRAEKMWQGHIATAIATATDRLQPKDSSPSPTPSSSSKKKIKDLVPKLSLGENGLVKLTEDELQKLTDKFGNDRTQEIIEIIDVKIASKGETGWRKDHKSDYATILYWEKQGWLEKKEHYI